MNPDDMEREIPSNSLYTQISYSKSKVSKYDKKMTAEKM